MKRILLPALAATVLMMASCGGNGTDGNADSMNKDSASNEVKKSFVDACKDGNKIAMTIKGYKYGMSGDFAYETANFEVKNATFHMMNDSTAEMTLSNYKPEELVGERKDDQIDINCEFYAIGGKKLAGSTFTYMDYKDNLSCTITMMTSKGKVYFNWLDGMADQGGATIYFAEDGKACGTFQLAVESTNDQVGTVRLNGTFKVGE